MDAQGQYGPGHLSRQKPTNGVYTRGSAGYNIVSTDTPSRHCGGVAVFYRTSPRYAVESIQKFSTNVVGFRLVAGGQQWYII